MVRRVTVFRSGVFLCFARTWKGYSKGLRRAIFGADEVQLPEGHYVLTDRPDRRPSMRVFRVDVVRHASRSCMARAFISTMRKGQPYGITVGGGYALWLLLCRYYVRKLGVKPGRTYWLKLVKKLDA